MFVVVIIVYIALLTLEFISLYQKKYWKDLWVNLTLGSISFIIALMISFHLYIPSPADPIKKIVLSLFKI
ncbi:MAG: hypothetical protein JG775_2031 [Defluviitaleaceae bacterium]|jgi:hypothetical protein|nr:hypothetical protein [Defluviitalea raffinosedens]MBZ4668879.1 hypothetical protein [Defluviitaleaceae bacterium]